MFSRLSEVIRNRVKSRRAQRGGVAVEFALITPVLIMLLLGTITTGMSYSDALGVTNAVREGARFGAIADSSSGSWTADVQDRVRATEFNDVGTPAPPWRTSLCVQLWRNSSGAAAVPGTTVHSQCVDNGPGVPSATDLARYPLPSVPDGVCVVRVVAVRSFTIEAPPFLPPIPRNMVRGSVARYEGTSC